MKSVERRGIKPKGKIKIKWSPRFAYAIGLIATDGCLLNEGRHIDLSSKDREMLINYKRCLNIGNKISYKNSLSKKAGLRVQLGDVLFYRFLLGIGLTPAKSKTLGKLDVPAKHFFDFLRGCFDGDGCFYSYWDPRWRSSFMYYLEFVSASKDFIDWIRQSLQGRLKVRGHITKDGKGSTYQLKYAKRESLKIIQKMYYSDTVVCLARKRKKIRKALKLGKSTRGWRN